VKERTRFSSVAFAADPMDAIVAGTKQDRSGERATVLDALQSEPPAWMTTIVMV